MSIDGVTVEQDDGHALCRIEKFSDELKDKIRSELVSVSYGAAQSASLPEYYSYKNTLTNFLDRYKNKPDDTKKGMIGELLAHVLMPTIFTNLASLSVYFNKEDRSIKKGFDIVYLDTSINDLWYSEVKSGHCPEDHDSDQANATLLARAHMGLKDMFLEGRQSLWDSALADVQLTFGDIKGKSAKAMLSADSPLIKKSSKSNDKNAILVSVLYECPTNPCSISGVKEYLDLVRTANDFKGVVIFSIQKKTFERVAEFLEAEISVNV